MSNKEALNRVYGKFAAYDVEFADAATLFQARMKLWDYLIANPGIKEISTDTILFPKAD